MLKFDKNNQFNPDDMTQYEDIVRFCKLCNTGKLLTKENYGYAPYDMFKKSLICIPCETVKNMDGM